MHCMRYVLVHESDCQSSQSSNEPEQDPMVWIENHHHHVNQYANYLRVSELGTKSSEDLRH